MLIYSLFMKIKNYFDLNNRKMAPLHPGEILAEFFMAKELKRFCNEYSIDYNDMECIVLGRKPITEEIADSISKHFGTSKEVWLGLQEDYDEEIGV